MVVVVVVVIIISVVVIGIIGALLSEYEKIYVSIRWNYFARHENNSRITFVFPIGGKENC